MACVKYKNLAKRMQSDKVWKDKAFEISSNLNYAWYQRVLFSMVYKFFDGKSKDRGIKSKPNQQLAEELHKPIIKIFLKKVYFSFKDNIWGVDLADMP